MDERKNGHSGTLDIASIPPLPPDTPAPYHNYGEGLKLTQDRQDFIVECLKKGYSMKATAALAGIHKSTLYRWLKNAREGDETYIAFLEAVEGAAATFEAEGIDAIVKAGKRGTWQAYAWMLERKHPDRWGRVQRNRHEGHEGGPIEFSLNMNVGKEPIQRIVEIEADDVPDEGADN